MDGYHAPLKNGRGRRRNQKSWLIRSKNLAAQTEIWATVSRRSSDNFTNIIANTSSVNGLVGMSSPREYPRNELLAKVRPLKEWTTWELQNLTILHTHAGREGGRGRRLREEFRFIRMTVRARRVSAYSLIHPSARSVRVRSLSHSLVRSPNRGWRRMGTISVRARTNSLRRESSELAGLAHAKRGLRVKCRGRTE